LFPTQGLNQVPDEMGREASLEKKTLFGSRRENLFHPGRGFLKKSKGGGVGGGGGGIHAAELALPQLKSGEKKKRKVNKTKVAPPKTVSKPGPRVRCPKYSAPKHPAQGEVAKRRGDAILSPEAQVARMSAMSSLQIKTGAGRTYNRKKSINERVDQPWVAQGMR